ncbi:hypothetical protein [Lysobacter sp. Root690]|uniref:hypothetical protein n=1 Tax=Lysobacter sp. Root690 TaxID=1736588 RepID=UPI0012F8F447|nr:hypothetical protein [Lysobacter sp. Root690]
MSIHIHQRSSRRRYVLPGLCLFVAACIAAPVQAQTATSKLTLTYLDSYLTPANQAVSAAVTYSTVPAGTTSGGGYTFLAPSTLTIVNSGTRFPGPRHTLETLTLHWQGASCTVFPVLLSLPDSSCGFDQPIWGITWAALIHNDGNGNYSFQLTGEL